MLVWTIGGWDGSGLRGILADISILKASNVRYHAFITCLTRQTTDQYLGHMHINPEVLYETLLQSWAIEKPAYVKIGLITDLHILKILYRFFKTHPTYIIYDPIKQPSFGPNCFCTAMYNFLIEYFLSVVTVITPNVIEAAWLAGGNSKDFKRINQQGPQYTLVTGIKTGAGYIDRLIHSHYQANFGLVTTLSSTKPGTGCRFAAMLTAQLAKGWHLYSAILQAQQTVSQYLGVKHYSFWAGQYLHPPCKPLTRKIGVYAIITDAHEMKKLICLGIKTFQVRIKGAVNQAMIDEIKQCILTAKEHKVWCFVNDHWQLAIELGADGVHLGQKDLFHSDISAIRKAGLYLGISTHTMFELARAQAFQPSYVALGPIFPTTTKVMPYPAQGIRRLKQWCQLSPVPVVAIGGIGYQNLRKVLKVHPGGIAMLTALRTTSVGAVAKIKCIVRVVKCYLTPQR